MSLNGDLPEEEVPTPWVKARQAARAACGDCEIKEELLPGVAEPVWSLVAHTADATCEICSLREVRQACQGCPLPEHLLRLARTVKRKEGVKAYARR